ncbi:MAG: manganese efflux pump, partial [Prevotella sp.]|nr:manganese efflux pump [Prevotella sp.]
AVGISFACMNYYHAFSSMALPLFIIFCASFLFAIVGHFLGIGFGKGISKRLKPELLGGIILILIGIKILYTHLFL